MDTVEARIKLTKRIDDIIQNAVNEGLFVTKTDLLKAAIIEYLDKMHLLDQVKNSIESKPLD